MRHLPTAQRVRKDPSADPGDEARGSADVQGWRISLMLRCPRKTRASKHPSALVYLSPRPSRPDEVGHLRVRGNLSMSKNPSFAAGRDDSLRMGHACLGSNPRIGRGARSNLSKYLYVAPSGASFGVFVPLTCVSLARRRRSLVLGSGPRMTGRGSGCRVMRDDASAWPVAREVPAGWCTNPTGTLARG